MTMIERKSEKQVSRRHFLVGVAAAGAGVTIGYAVAPRILGSATEAFASGTYSPTPLYTISPAGLVTIHVNKSEMGQHIGTTIGQEVAEELEVSWQNVRLDYPDFAAFFTGGSSSTWTNFVDASQAGAAGRMALIDAAAKHLGVAPSACHAEKGWVIAKGGKRVSYAELVASGKVDRVFKADELKKIALKKAKEYRVLGQTVPALDIPVKTNGRAVFGIDYFRDDLVYAKIARPPVRIGAKPKKGADGKELIDDSAAKKVPGYTQFLSIPDPLGGPHYVIAIANSYPAAMKAARALKVDWDLGPNADVSSESILARAKDLVADPNSGGAFWLIGDVKKGMAAAATKIEAVYTTPLAAHMTLEPMNAVAFFDHDVLHIYSGSQLQVAHTPIVAAAMGMKPDKVMLHQVYLGGGFGRRLDAQDVMIPTALAAKALGRAVKLIYTRDEDIRNDFYRSITYQRLQGGLDKDGRLVAIQHDVCTAYSAARANPAIMEPSKDKGAKVKTDVTSLGGADSWYDIPNYYARGIENDVAQRATPPGFLRSVSEGWTYFALETFLDEVARKAGKDPAEFRIAMLKAVGPNSGQAPMSTGGAVRMANLIRQAVKITHFSKKHGGKLGANKGIGLATSTFGLTRGVPTWTCGVVEVTVDRNSGAIHIDKITSVLDMGVALNPNGALSQCEGATLWGVSLALYENATMHHGNIDQANFDTYTPLRMEQVPNIEIHLLDTGNPPTGLGEPATTVVAPAISNAVFDAVGVRLRDLPFTSQKVKAALKA